MDGLFMFLALSFYVCASSSSFRALSFQLLSPRDYNHLAHLDRHRFRSTSARMQQRDNDVTSNPKVHTTVDDSTIANTIVDLFFSQNPYMAASSKVHSIRETFDVVPGPTTIPTSFSTNANPGITASSSIARLLRHKFVQYTWIKGGDLFLDPFPPKILSSPTTTYSGKGCQRRVGPGIIEEIFDVGTVMVVESKKKSEEINRNNGKGTNVSSYYSFIRYRVLNPSLLLYPVRAHEGCLIFSQTGRNCIWAVQWVPFVGLQWYVNGLTSIVIKNLIHNFKAYIFLKGLEVEKDIDDNRLQRHQEETNLVYDPATQSIKSLDSTTNSSSLRILALHGKGGSGPSFYQTLTPLLEQLSGYKSDIATDNNINGGETSVQCDCLTAPLPEGKWWEQHPPGSRSYNAASYEGYEKAADMVQSALSLKADNHYDILLGHSQGAILIVSMLANKDLTNANTPPLLILNGVAWPKPFGRQLAELKLCYPNDETCTSPKKIPAKSDQAINETSYFSKSTKAKALFIMGENDKINPIQGAMLVRDNLLKAGLDVSTIVHSGGHSLPTENKVILESIIQWIHQPSHSRKKAG